VDNSLVINSKDQWVLLQKQCKAFIASGFLPDHVTKGASADQAMAKAITIAMKGRELGIPPLQAFSSISVIRGRPCLSSELMLALIYQRIPGAKVTFVTPTERHHLECVVTMQRPGGAEQKFSFTIEDAKAAGLLGKADSAWEKYPKAMLRARAVSAGARAVFPDAIMGCYTPEEMGADIVDVEAAEETAVEGAAISDKPIIQIKADDKSPRQTTPNKHGDWPNVPGWENHSATEGQIRRLYAIGKETLGLDGDELHNALKDLANKVAGVEHLDMLTKSQVQDVFRELIGR